LLVQGVAAFISTMSSEVAAKKTANGKPPAVITVDTKKEEEEEDNASAGQTKTDPSAQARTPKHANRDKKDGGAAATREKPPSAPPQVSPGGPGGVPRYYNQFPPQGRFPPGHQQPFPPMYHRFDRPLPPGYGGPRYMMPEYPQGRWPPQYRMPPNQVPSNMFSRAVSSSFDRSIKSRQQDNLSDDGSWKALNQVQSVDEDEMRKRKEPAASTNSSLTNSPTEEMEKPSRKQASSLDSLSSVASTQEPMKRSGSPSGSTGSLDLMKCPSGTSNLLLPSHQRSLSQFSMNDSLPASKKPKKESPLSIACSPPGSPSQKRRGSLGDDTRAPPSLGQIPSWEIQAQDSFGGGSQMGGFTQSFSFPPNDVNTSGSMDMGMRNPEMVLESRNQSFDAGHHMLARNDSMYDGRMGPHDGRMMPGPYHSLHAPSFGSAASYHYPPPMMRGQYPPMMRNHSEDSSQATPPIGMRKLPPNFQPPADFRVPPPQAMQKRQEHTLMTSPHMAKTAGAFGWTKEEDSRLTEVMKKFKAPRNWEPIAKELGSGRSAKECHERWIRYLKPGVRKGQWTDYEDAIVMEVVQNSSEQPFTRWSDLAQRLPGRVGKQIRDRWVNHLNPELDHMPFRREEDMLLWEGHQKLGKRWVEISTKYFHSRRSENHIKNRWYSANFKKIIANEFGPTAYAGSKKASPKKKKKEVEL